MIESLSNLFTTEAPVFAQAKTLHVLAWSHVIKEADALMRDKLLPEFKKASGITAKYGCQFRPLSS